MCGTLQQKPLNDSRKTWAEKQREGELNALAPLTWVWYFLFLFFINPTSSWKPFGHSVSAPWCRSLCHGAEGQRHPRRPHLVCQQFSEPTVRHPLSICCPSATTVCPVPTPLFFHSEPYCVPLSPTQPHSLLPLGVFDENTQALSAV